MRNVVFVLGAGASRQSGAPLMNTFLEAASDLLESGRIGDDARYFQHVLDAVAALQRVHSKANIDLWNIESVLAAIEMGQLLQRFLDYDILGLDGLGRAVRTVLVRTIEETQVYPTVNGRPQVLEPYGSFVGIIGDLWKKAAKLGSVSVITFNYDLALDHAFEFGGMQPNYGLKESDLGGIPLLKLHGSLNWGRCRVCKEIVPWRITDFIKKSRNQVSSDGTMALRLGSYIGELEHEKCRARNKDKPVPHAEERPIIVPPTWSKSLYQKEISTVWSRAAKELASAEELHIIGYSLRASDEFFRYLYAIGTVGKHLIRRFVVYDPDETAQVEQRYRQLIGPAVTQRFHFERVTFQKALPMIRDTMERRLDTP